MSFGTLSVRVFQHAEDERLSRPGVGNPDP